MWKQILFNLGGNKSKSAQYFNKSTWLVLLWQKANGVKIPFNIKNIYAKQQQNDGVLFLIILNACMHSLILPIDMN